MCGQYEICGTPLIQSVSRYAQIVRESQTDSRSMHIYFVTMENSCVQHAGETAEPYVLYVYMRAIEVMGYSLLFNCT